MLTTPTSTSAVNGRPPDPPDPQLPETSTSAQPIPTAPLPSTATTAPPDSQPNWQDFTYPTDSSQRPNNPRGPASASAPPLQRIPVIEYQWGDELVSHLLGLPPRSNFGGKFGIIADPSVDNVMRAQMFAEQLRSKGVHISYVGSHTLPFRRAPHFLPFVSCVPRGQGKTYRIAHTGHPSRTHALLPLQVRGRV
jgi:hypothetical protein